MDKDIFLNDKINEAEVVAEALLSLTLPDMLIAVGLAMMKAGLDLGEDGSPEKTVIAKTGVVSTEVEAP